MSEQTRPFELVEFEQVDAAPGTALLRITARPSAAAQAGPWTLILSSGRQAHRHEQLPAIPGPPGVMRAAFSAPVEQCAPGTRFTLEFSDGSHLQLPSPSHRRRVSPASRPASEVELPSSSRSQDARRLEAERRAESRRLEVVELERRLQAEAERHSAELERVRAATQLAHERAHASRRELTAIDEQHAHAQAQVTVLEEALATRTSEVDGLTAQAHQQALAAKQQAAAAKQQTAAADERAAEMEEQIKSLRELAQRTGTQHAVELQTSESRRDVTQAELEIARAELRALKSQNERLESTAAEVDRALAVREAEIDLLHGAVVESRTVERDISESVRRLADEQVASRLADARSEASTALIAEIEVLRLQLRELQEQAHTLKRTYEESDRRALAAEGELSKRKRQLDDLSSELSRSQTTEQELRRVRDAAALVAAELMNASDAVTQARGEATAHRQRAEELQQALLDAAAERVLEKDFLAIEKQAHEEALFSRLAEVQATADAAIDVAREQR